VLWTVSAAAFLAVAWMQVGSWAYQARAEWMLAARARVGAVRTPAAAMPRPDLETGAPLGRIEVPRLGLSAVIAEGTTALVLSRAVGHVPSTARPGEPGNVALAGHRDTFFRPLEDVRAGDRIRVETPATDDVYRVEWTAVVAPEETDVMAPSSDAILTLVTCHPFRFVGTAPNRFVVRARRESTDDLPGMPAGRADTAAIPAEEPPPAS
jgi:sortase A